jgi:hypothetical protein
VTYIKSDKMNPGQVSAYELLLFPRIASRKETVLRCLTNLADSILHSAFDSTEDWKMELQLSACELCFNI